MCSSLGNHALVPPDESAVKVNFDVGMIGKCVCGWGVVSRAGAREILWSVVA